MLQAGIIDWQHEDTEVLSIGDIGNIIMTNRNLEYDCASIGDLLVWRKSKYVFEKIQVHQFSLIIIHGKVPFNFRLQSTYSTSEKWEIFEC